MSAAPNSVPYLPENAPFSPEQRAYLNGFLAGLFARAPGPVATPTSPPGPVAPPLLPLAILFGSQTGNAENLARRAAREAGKRGFATTLHDLARITPAQLAAERHVIVITSTYGDGEPPDNARTFWETLSADGAPRLESLHYSLCALGDTSYAKFCGFGRDLDERLAALGAQRAAPRVECDADFEAAFLQWLPMALTALTDEGRKGEGARSTDTAEPAGEPHPLTSSFSPTGGEGAQRAGEGASRTVALHPANNEQASPYSRQRPFPSRLRTNRRLNAPGSEKDVRHFELDLSGSGLAYEVGDALGVQPENNPALVSELLEAMRLTGEEPVAGRDGSQIPLREALLRHYEITRIPAPLLQAFATRTGDAGLRRVTDPAANGELTRFLLGREIIDLFLAHPEVRWVPAEFVGCLRKLQPRLYSISSSPKAHPGEVHLTVGTVRYQSLGRTRHGVCSTFLADRVDADTPVPIFVHSNPSFRPPPPDRDLIMVGPGTGIAPFRAFLEERLAIGATGRNWLFFGDQRSATDFLYAEEIAAFERGGSLTRLDLAWSRDQATKDYVQHRMLEHAAELWSWLEEGASFHVCGDATRMAKDVDVALHEVVVRGGGRRPEQAAALVSALRAAGRYRRDVY